RPPISTLFPYTTLFRSADAISVPQRKAKAPPRLFCHVALFTARTTSPERPKLAILLKYRVAFCPSSEMKLRRPMSMRRELPLARSEEHTSELQSRENLV